MVRSLVLTLGTPHPPRAGADIRNRRIIGALVEHGPVDVVALGARLPPEPLSGVDRYLSYSHPELDAHRSRLERLRHRAWFLAPRSHWRMNRYLSVRAQSEIARAAEERPPDLVVAEQWSTAPLALPLSRGAALVFDTHNVEAQLLRSLDPLPFEATWCRSARLGSFRHRASLRRVDWWERRLHDRADQVWVCSESDAQVWESHHGPSSKLRVVPNTVEMGEFAGAASRHADEMVLIGNFAYRPNEEAAIEMMSAVLPEVRARRSNAFLHLVGRDAPPRLATLAQRTPGVRYIGEVPDVGPHLRSAGVMVLPIRAGGGTRQKILEAMAAGLPIVTTKKGAEGIDAVDGREILLAETPSQLAEAAVAVMADTAVADALARNGRELVRGRYGDEVLRQAVRGCIAELSLERSRASSPRSRA